MWWRKKPVSEKSLREQLIDARDALESQIAILEAGPSYLITPDAINGRLMRAAPLKVTLAEIKEQIASLEADDAQGS
ncbi:MAG: hypothetical protein P4L73_12520 [Caulobacteraceae bacterium]|nr:hypothetical protein [Caulobacteraceae bacterium]